MTCSDNMEHIGSLALMLCDDGPPSRVNSVFRTIHGKQYLHQPKQDLMHAEVVSNLQRFNARRKLRAAAIASVLSSKVALRAKRLRS
jgi:hypothetical protein